MQCILCVTLSMCLYESKVLLWCFAISGNMHAAKPRSQVFREKWERKPMRCSLASFPGLPTPERSGRGSPGNETHVALASFPGLPREVGEEGLGVRLHAAKPCTVPRPFLRTVCAINTNNTVMDYVSLGTRLA